MRRLVLLIALYSAMLFAAAANADDSKNRLVVGGGAFGVTDNEGSAVVAASYELAAMENWWGIRPHTMLIVGDAHDRYYAGLGVFKSLQLSENWHVGLGTMVGYYHTSQAKADNGNELGYDIEFYSRVFTEYQVMPAHRVRLEAGHISNASQDKRNPGSNSVIVSWVIDL